MLLQISTAHQPATDLGYLLHKHPERFQTLPLSYGKAHIYYPIANEDKATVCLLLEVDPIDMVKKSRRLSGKGFTLGQYVNDRPYVTSSFMSVAIAKAFSTAMNGTCTTKPELVEKTLPFEVHISVVSAPRGGESMIRKFFEPLGYEVHVERHILDATFPEWGNSKYFTVTLKNNMLTKDLLSHLYVLLPALDNDKHYFVSRDEIDKLLNKGKGWLEEHPEREQIVSRYLLNFRSLARQAMQRLLPEEEALEKEFSKRKNAQYVGLHQKRLEAVFEHLKNSGAKRVLDLGCGEGKLLRMLFKEKQFNFIAGTDVSLNELSRAKEKLYWDEMAPIQKERITLFQGALTYRDKRLMGYDAAALVEVIEHLDEDRLSALERVVFEFAQPKTVIVTTPNKEYNTLFENMSEDQFRHADHRFEWTRNEFQQWASQVAKNFSYQVNFFPIGEEAKSVGAPSQMAVFSYEP